VPRNEVKGKKGKVNPPAGGALTALWWPIAVLPTLVFSVQSSKCLSTRRDGHYFDFKDLELCGFS
jgi:hypothetical protein